MTLISAKIDVTALHCTQLFEPPLFKFLEDYYLWFAYFFADVTTVSTSQPISVFVPLVSDTRALFPNYIGKDEDVPIPPEVGTFQVNLDDGGGDTPIALLGVLIVQLSRIDTPDDAIAAGYDAYRDAVLRELNNFVIANGPVVPTDDQIRQIADAIGNSVRSAISSKLSIWQKIFDNQDELIGHSHALFFGPQLSVAANVIVSEPLGLRPIDEGLLGRVFRHFEFVNPLLTLQQVVPPDPCADQQKAVTAGFDNLKVLRDALNALLKKLQTAPPGEREFIQVEIQKARNDIVLAQKALDLALIALRSCRLQVSRGGGIIQGAANSLPASSPS